MESLLLPGKVSRRLPSRVFKVRGVALLGAWVSGVGSDVRTVWLLGWNAALALAGGGRPQQVEGRAWPACSWRAGSWHLLGSGQAETRRPCLLDTFSPWWFHVRSARVGALAVSRWVTACRLPACVVRRVVEAEMGMAPPRPAWGLRRAWFLFPRPLPGPVCCGHVGLVGNSRDLCCLRRELALRLGPHSIAGTRPWQPAAERVPVCEVSGPLRQALACTGVAKGLLKVAVTHWPLAVAETSLCLDMDQTS